MAAGYGMITWLRHREERDYLLRTIASIQKQFEQPSSMIAGDVGLPLVMRLDPDERSAFERNDAMTHMVLYALVEGPHGQGKYIWKLNGSYSVSPKPGDPDNFARWSFKGFDVDMIGGSLALD